MYSDTRNFTMRVNSKKFSTWYAFAQYQGSTALAKWPSLKSRTVQKSLYNFRLTIVCGMITILVLRGTVGIGSLFDDEEQPERRHLGTIERFLMQDLEEDTEEVENSSVPYALGAPITDWDEQRAQWLQRHPNATKNNLGKDRVLLVSGSHPSSCENSIGDHLLVKALKNKVDYCRLYDIELFYSLAQLDTQMTGFWVKHPMVRKLMLAHPEVEWIWWMDSDAFITDMMFEIPLDRYKEHNMVVHGFDNRLYGAKSWVGINAGSFLIRNCQWSLDMLDAWTSMGHPSVRKKYGKILSQVLLDRPVFDSDDQSVLAYMLITEREKWGPKVYLEQGYFLHGYWVILVDRYEEMMENNQPGSGDKRWPFVTHFVGCKPCGYKFNTYGVERCLLQMERAFNFGDNQILEQYGFRHRSLNSSDYVDRVRPDSADPLGLGLAVRDASTTSSFATL